MAAKSQTLGVVQNTNQTWKEIVNEVVIGTYTIPNYLGSFWRSRNWNTTTGWKSILESRGWLATTGYNDTTYRIPRRYQPSGKTRFRLKTDARKGWDILNGLVPVPTPSQIGLLAADPNGIELDVKNRCLAKARDMRVNLAVATAEGRKTIDMVTDAVKTLGRAYGAFRKGRFKEAARALNIGDIERSLANNWLAYQYGWKPLVSDAQGLLDTHRANMSAPWKQRYVVRASKTEVKTSVYRWANYLVTGNHALVYRTDVYTARAGILVEVTSRGQKLNASLGLSPGDLSLAAWELIPFSFVFDWFVDVGTWLGNLNALDGLAVLDGWVISERSRTVNVLPSSGSGSLYTSNVPDALGTTRRFDRNPWNPGSMTWPRVNSITDLSWQRMISSAALFSQQFRGDPPIGKFRPRSSD